MDEIVSEILDSSRKTVLSLDSMETYILRKRLGVFNNGIKQSIEELKKDLESIIPISLGNLKTIYSILYFKIRTGSDINPYAKKMDSILDKTKLKKIKLDLDEKVIDYLKSKNINSISEILNYSIYDYIKMDMPNDILKLLIDFIHKKKLKFINELTLYERKKIVKSASLSTIYNSSISFIFSEKEEYLKYCRFNTIGNIINNFKSLSDDEKSEVTKYMKKFDLVINIPKSNDIDYSLAETKNLLSKPISEIFKSDISSLLIEKRILKIYDLINLDRYSLLRNYGLNEKQYATIIKSIKNMNLHFKDEITLTKEEQKFLVLLTKEEKKRIEEHEGLLNKKRQIEEELRKTNAQIRSSESDINLINGIFSKYSLKGTYSSSNDVIIRRREKK